MAVTQEFKQAVLQHDFRFKIVILQYSLLKFLRYSH